MYIDQKNVLGVIEERKNLKISIEEMAEKLNLPVGLLKKFEDGKELEYDNLIKKSYEIVLNKHKLNIELVKCNLILNHYRWNGDY